MVTVSFTGENDGDVAISTLYWAALATGPHSRSRALPGTFAPSAGATSAGASLRMVNVRSWPLVSGALHGPLRLSASKRRIRQP